MTILSPINPHNSQKMNDFKDYLISQGYTNSTAHTYVRDVQDYLTWLKVQRLKEEEVTYRDLLVYVKHLSKRELTQRTITYYINSIKKYYDYLQTPENPVKNIEIKGRQKRTVYDILTPTELENLYANYQNQTSAGKRNKVIIGLMVYQGLTTGDLARLEIAHIKLREGKIEVPGNAKTSERTLELKAHQLLDLQEYMMLVRKELLEQTKKESTALIVSTGSSHKQNNLYLSLIKQLKRQAPKLKNYQQLRASVITRWVKTMNLREAQYRAGHKYISSTEKYKVNDLEGLQEDISKYFPL